MYGWFLLATYCQSSHNNPQALPESQGVEHTNQNSIRTHIYLFRALNILIETQNSVAAKHIINFWWQLVIWWQRLYHQP